MRPASGNDHPYRFRSHRSLVDLVYRLVDAAAIIVAAYVAIKQTPAAPLSSLAAVVGATLLVHVVAIEVSGLYRNWRGSQLSRELWCVVITWIYTAPTVLGIGLLTQANAQFSYASKLLWLGLTPVAMVG